MYNSSSALLLEKDSLTTKVHSKHLRNVMLKTWDDYKKTGPTFRDKVTVVTSTAECKRRFGKNLNNRTATDIVHGVVVLEKDQVRGHVLMSIVSSCPKRIAKLSKSAMLSSGNRPMYFPISYATSVIAKFRHIRVSSSG